MVVGYVILRSHRTRLTDGSLSKNHPKGWLFVITIIYLFVFLSARVFGDSIRPFFFNVRNAEADTLHFTFWPFIIKVRFDTFGLNTLRVCLWENDTLCPYILPFPVISQIAIYFSFTVLTIFLNASGLFTARSAKILRSSEIPLAFIPAISCE